MDFWFINNGPFVRNFPSDCTAHERWFASPNIHCCSFVMFSWKSVILLSLRSVQSEGKFQINVSLILSSMFPWSPFSQLQLSRDSTSFILGMANAEKVAAQRKGLSIIYPVWKNYSGFWIQSRVNQWNILV